MMGVVLCFVFIVPICAMIGIIRQFNKKAVLSHQKKEFLIGHGITDEELDQNNAKTKEEKERAKGIFGEYEAYKSAMNLRGEKRVLFSVLIPEDNEQNTDFQEIDMLVFHGSTIYVIEAKAKKDIVKIDYTTEIARYGIDQRGLYKMHDFYSPIVQNHRHLTSLKGYLVKQGIDINKINFIPITIIGGETIIREMNENADVRYVNIDGLIFNARNAAAYFSQRKDSAVTPEIIKSFEMIRSIQPSKAMKEMLIEQRINYQNFDHSKSVEYAVGDSAQIETAGMETLYRIRGNCVECLMLCKNEKGEFGNPLNNESYKWFFAGNFKRGDAKKAYNLSFISKGYTAGDTEYIREIKYNEYVKYLNDLFIVIKDQNFISITMKSGLTEFVRKPRFIRGYILPVK